MNSSALKTLVCRDQLISVEMQGKADRSLILLHGWGQTHASFQIFIPALAEMGYAVIAPDLPGFGKSELPKKPFTVDDYADVVLEMIKKLNVKIPLVLGGHSFGGRIAIKIAARHPELVEKLVLIDSAGVTKRNNFRSRLLKNVAAVGKIALSLPIFSTAFRARIRRSLYETIGSTDYLAAGPLRETFLKIIAEDLTALAPSITVPTLLLWGEKDRDTPLADAKKLHSLIPDSQLVSFQNAGHFCFLDEPVEFLKALKKFL